MFGGQRRQREVERDGGGSRAIVTLRASFAEGAGLLGGDVVGPGVGGDGILAIGAGEGRSLPAWTNSPGKAVACIVTDGALKGAGGVAVDLHLVDRGQLDRLVEDEYGSGGLQRLLETQREESGRAASPRSGSNAVSSAHVQDVGPVVRAGVELLQAEGAVMRSNASRMTILVIVCGVSHRVPSKDPSKSPR